MDNKGGFKKIGGFLLGGLIFGLVAGMMIVVMISVFLPSGLRKSEKDETTASAVAEADAEETESKDTSESDTEDETASDSEEPIEFSGEEIQVTEQTQQEQTVVTDVTRLSLS